MPERRVGRLPEEEKEKEENTTPDFIKERISKIQDEEQRREQAKDQGIDPEEVGAAPSEDNSSDSGGGSGNTRPDIEELREIGEQDSPSNQQEKADVVEQAEREADVNEAVRVETDRFGNPINAETIDFRNLESNDPDNRREVPTVNREASQEIRSRQAKAQRQAMQLAENQRIENLNKAQLRFTENRLNRIQNQDGDQEIRLGNETTTVSERRNELRGRKNTIEDSLEQADQFDRKGTQVLQNTRENIEQVREEQNTVTQQDVNRLLGDYDTPKMTAPGTELGQEQDTFPDIGQQEFAGGTQNINADFREERNPEPERNVAAPLSEQSRNIGRITSSGLQNIGAPAGFSRTVGRGAGTTVSFIGGTLQGIENAPQAIDTFIDNPGETLEETRESLEEDAVGRRASDLTDQEITNVLGEAGTEQITEGEISRATGNAEVLMLPTAGFSAGTAARTASTAVRAGRSSLSTAGDVAGSAARPVARNLRRGGPETTTVRDFFEGDLPERALTRDEIREQFSQEDIIMGRNNPDTSGSLPGTEMTRTEFLQERGIPLGRSPQDFAGREIESSNPIVDTLTNTRKGQLQTVQRTRPETDTNTDDVISISDRVERIEDRIRSVGRRDDNRISGTRRTPERRRRSEFNRPDNDIDTDLTDGLALGLGAAAASTQGQSQSSFQDQGQGQTQGQEQSQPQEFQQSPENSFNPFNRSENELRRLFRDEGRTPRETRREQEASRARRGRDLPDGDLDFEGTVTQVDDNDESDERGFDFAPDLGSILSGNTITEEQAQEQGLLDDTFSGFESRPEIIDTDRL